MLGGRKDDKKIVTSNHSQNIKILHSWLTQICIFLCKVFCILKVTQYRAQEVVIIFLNFLH
jgi:hypothetical protein